MKIVVVLVAVLLLVWLLLGSSRRRAKDAHRDRPAPPAAPPPGAVRQVEDMVSCAHCGVHLPGSLALRDRDHTYCSAPHREAGARSDGDG
jgi:uncharacterized protein